MVPYLGSGVFEPALGGCSVPISRPELAAALAAVVPVPGRIRGQLSTVAQYIEGKRHRKTLNGALASLFAEPAPLTPAHRWVAGLPPPPLVVDTWYDDALARALAAAARPPESWCMMVGQSHPQTLGHWVKSYSGAGKPIAEKEVALAQTIVYKPFGGMVPEPGFVISDSDLVEVLTEIDIQTPIPQAIQDRRGGRHFLFLGCRFDDEVARTFARQISKRSSDRHWAVIEGGLSRNEARFVEEGGIVVLDLPLVEAIGRLAC
ncbi:MAG: SIR2 family protein [Azospirillum sp.]|nr:SIR2 family protein [Azospirillum sp.]